MNYSRRSILTWLLIATLLFLRLPFLTGLPMLVSGPLPWLDPLFQIITYGLTAFIIWWERGQLADFHIDRLSIWIILLFKPLETLILAAWGLDTPLAFPNLPSLAFWLIAILLGLALWKNRSLLPKFQLKSLGWFALGAGTGIFLSFVFSLLTIVLLHPVGNPLPADLPAFFLAFPYQLGYAAVDEEPLFRGFLWGALHTSRWRELWIWLLQAALFAAGHLFLLSTQPFLVLEIFFLALALGALAWRSRSLSSSMAAHAFYNGIAPLLSYVLLNSGIFS